MRASQGRTGIVSQVGMYHMGVIPKAKPLNKEQNANEALCKVTWALELDPYPSISRSKINAATRSK